MISFPPRAQTSAPSAGESGSGYHALSTVISLPAFGLQQMGHREIQGHIPSPAAHPRPGLPTLLPTRLWSFGLRGVVLRLEAMEAGLSGISRRAGGSRLLGVRLGLPGSEGGSWGKRRSLRSGNPSPSAQEGRDNRGPREPPPDQSTAGTVKPPTAPRCLLGKLLVQPLAVPCLPKQH